MKTKFFFKNSLILTQILVFFLLSSILFSCTVSEKSKRGLKFSFLTGYGYGGIVENTDLSIIPNASPTQESTVDAYSGSTIGGANIGLHINKTLFFGEFQTGAEFLYNYQSFSYADNGNMFIGVRKLHVNQFLFPITYNFVLLKKLAPQSEIQIKIGFLGQYNILSVTDIGITPLPDYKINNWSQGAVLGISAYPLILNNDSKLGFYCEVYRGSRIYTDFYNQENFEMPGSSFLKIGIKYQFLTILKNYQK